MMHAGCGVKRIHHLYNRSSDGKTSSQPSGYFLMEIAKPFKKFLDVGREPPHDPLGVSIAAFVGNCYERQRDLDLMERMKKENGLASLRRFSAISDDELKSYGAVFIPGGHAPLTDLGDNPELGALCHGPRAFLLTKYGPQKEFTYESGAEMIEGIAKSLGSITVDRELVTGDNPMSADGIADKMLEMLAAE
ncbi:class I glutamine amidotransferase-like protein [Cucurbitaria berberidis CBS 394.84]|uniref:Class I glutamine amidotransferase-like protein n=1 Tax=Cucurbitaria berberidis CBS 394.84 TaxID=1168544 RepID=A0A9P4GID8_9PLEO|nr:class I glutamine amidotransferase-like protein [Cucurbitaria berberidis CBS 394.84]KAF1846150.1 class I glutamine amidotransferase-like protein [Cucurbitaria berberidis CBS 394.84]